MTLAMPDSINVGNLPPGYDAYLGYTDGRWPTAVELAKRFPAAELVLLTVTGGNTAAHGVKLLYGADVEPGDLNPQDAAGWARRKLDTEPTSRPVLYASVLAMATVMTALVDAGVILTDVRLLSAHYGRGAHICGPSSCGLIGVEMDGTQWTDAFVVANSQGLPVNIDMSMLADDFFTGSTGLNWTERLVQELGTVQAGMTGEAVKTVQGLCNARMPVAELAIDGVFGNRTRLTVLSLQADAKITADGIVGPQTWPVLLGVA